MTAEPLHQIIPGADPYDAITRQALHFQSWLRESGIPSNIYAPHIADDSEMMRAVRPLSAFPRKAAQRLIYHHSVGLPDVLPMIAGQPTALVYHNITPPSFFTASDPGLAQRLQQGRQQLADLQPYVILTIGDSRFNLRELDPLGFQPQAVVPIAIDLLPTRKFLNVAPAQQTAGVHLLFVGRVVPNKRQEDLIRLLAACRTIGLDTRLTLIGKPEAAGYSRWLDELIADRGLTSFVDRPGQVTDETLAQAYQEATVYVSMSEHEGFGKPLIEAMVARLPVVAFAAAAVPETMGEAGILFAKKEFALLAELIAYLHQPQNRPFVERLIDRQVARAADFTPAAVKKQFFAALGSVGWV